MNYKLQILTMISLTTFIYAIDTTNNHISADGTGETYISSQTFSNKKIYYDIKDDLAIFEGDIILGTVDEAEGWRETEESEYDNSSSTEQNTSEAQIIKGARYRWPNGIIPYTIASNVSSKTRGLISRAIAHISAHTSVRFVPRTSSHPNYVGIRSDKNACFSNVGNLKNGKQIVNVVAGCGYGGTIHELTHAIGLWHEQSRIDRNNYVRINWQNIPQSKKHNFNQHINDGVDIGSYDYGSLMHYSAYAFGNGKQTITPLQSGVHIGQRNGLSQGDIAAINHMYPGGGGSSSTSWTTGAYSNNQDTSKTLSISGSSALTVRVSGATEANYDFIYIYNASGQLVKKLHGNINTSFTVSGASIRARLKTDHSVTKGGVTVSISESSGGGGGGGGSTSNVNYEFNSNNNAQGWSYRNLRQHGSGPTGGVWYFQAKYNDPQLISPSLNINANVIKKVVIQMANDHNPSYYSKLQVFWKKNGQGYSESNSQTISVTNHGGWSTYTIDMSNNPRWNGNIKEIRIDPIYRGDGHWLAFNYIRFIQ